MVWRSTQPGAVSFCTLLELIAGAGTLRERTLDVECGTTGLWLASSWNCFVLTSFLFSQFFFRFWQRCLLCLSPAIHLEYQRSSLWTSSVDKLSALCCIPKFEDCPLGDAVLQRPAMKCVIMCVTFTPYINILYMYTCVYVCVCTFLKLSLIGWSHTLTWTQGQLKV